MKFFKDGEATWSKIDRFPAISFRCGYCGDQVSTGEGYSIRQHGDGSGKRIGFICICPGCNGPSFFSPVGEQFPGPILGRWIDHLPNDLEQVYEEARKCTTISCYTSAVLMCRKMLMNIAVQQGADEGKKFIEYVDFLSTKGYVPPGGKDWVDHIRKKGNEATHEIAVMSKEDAENLLSFTEMLLIFIYEFPARVPSP